MPRAALRLALALVGAAVLATPAAAAEPGLLVTVGEVTDTSAVVWVRGISWGEVSVRYAPATRPVGAGLGVGSSADIRVGPSHHLTGKTLLQGLEPATRYRYTISQGTATVAGEFVTAPAATLAVPVRFAWSGDLGSRGHCRRAGDAYPIFRALGQVPADFFLFVGDTIYADHECGESKRVPGYDFVARRLADFWAKHRHNRNDPAGQAYFRATSVYAIWDDHEVRNDFSGPSEPLTEIGRRAFIDYFPVRPPAEEPGRLYRKFRWGALLELFILDTRQYRSPDSTPDGPGKTMLGPAQRRWLIDSVSASTAVWKVVVSTVPLSVPTGGRTHDSWSNANAQGVPDERGTGFAVERDTILRTLRQRGVRNLVFLAADVHFSQLIRHRPGFGGPGSDWSFHEFIAGPLAATPGQPRPLDQGLGPRSLWSLGGTSTFGDIAIDTGGLTVRIVDGEGQARFVHTIGAE